MTATSERSDQLTRATYRRQTRPARVPDLDVVADRLASATRGGQHRARYCPRERPPYGPLLLMAAAGFITMLTEALPVAVMPALRAGTGWSDGTIGQLVTAYAIGCGVAALPMTLLTRGVDRRQLLLATLATFVVANTATMLTTLAPFMLLARFLAGASAGLTWAILAGYATRLVHEQIAGRAMAVAMAGTPLALALGIPFGTFLGQALGWRLAFLAVSALAGTVLVVGLAILPDIDGETGGRRPSAQAVLALPGMRSVMLVTALFAMGHNLVYTFVPTFVTGRQDVSLATMLLVFGVGAVVGLTYIGRHVDTRLAPLLRISCIALVACLLAVETLGALPGPVVVLLMGVWGLVFGGSPTLIQTASARLTGSAQDVGQALVVTVWNGFVAVAAAGGGLLVDGGQTWTVPLLAAILAVGAVVAAGGVAGALFEQSWADPGISDR